MSYLLIFLFLYWLLISLLLFIELADRVKFCDSFLSLVLCLFWPIILPYGIFILHLINDNIINEIKMLKKHMLYTEHKTPYGDQPHGIPEGWIVLHLGQNKDFKWECTLFNMANGRYVFYDNEEIMLSCVNGAIKKAKGSDMESI